jgi:hypothetical protein
MHLQYFDCGFARQSIEPSYIRVLINALSLCVHSGFQATTVDVQVFESALGLGLKMNRTQPVVFFGVPRQDQLASYLHPLIGFQSHRINSDGIDILSTALAIDLYES